MRVAANIIFGTALLLGVIAVFFVVEISYLRPRTTEALPHRFEILQGEGVRLIATRLEEANLIRSHKAFMIWAFLTGHWKSVKPGIYMLSSADWSGAILQVIKAGATNEVEIVIPEGSTIRDIDVILSRARVTEAGYVLAYAKAQNLEGKLFPDTYRFFEGSAPELVVRKLYENFLAKGGSILAANAAQARENLILASLLEREVPEKEDRRIVAGILLKRLKEGMPLQVDATLCYIKQGSCYPILKTDLESSSLYNTYKVKGFPPGPIGNPGVEALEAAMNPAPSPYWYYLSDPATKKTIFSKTFEEHVENKARYLHGVFYPLTVFLS